MKTRQPIPPAAVEWIDPTLLPVQHPARGAEADPHRGVRGLMVAILSDALFCLALGRATQVTARRLGRDALSWVLSEDRSGLFAFGSICDALGLDSGSLRQRLLAMPRDLPRRRDPGRVHRVEAHHVAIVAPRVRRRPEPRRRRRSIRDRSVA
ncbi:hypothetical protein KGQ64_10260 [bacterium]|nr:hypothetical protein [bacterium]